MILRFYWKLTDYLEVLNVNIVRKPLLCLRTRFRKQTACHSYRDGTRLISMQLNLNKICIPATLT